MSHQRWILGYLHYISPRKKVKKTEPTLALKPRVEVTRNPKQGYQWPQNRTCECVRQKELLKIIIKKYIHTNSANLNPFEFEPTLTFVDVCGEVTGCAAGQQEVSLCSTIGVSQGMSITFSSTKNQIRQSPLWL